MIAMLHRQMIARLLAALLCELTTLSAFAQEPPSEVAGSIVPLDGAASAGKAVASKLRIIMDTDALAEVDDQHAIAYMLFSGDHFDVEGITVNRGSDGGQPYHRDLGIDDHFAEAVNVLKMCGADVPVLKGPAGNYQQLQGEVEKSTFDGSDAVHFIIERAHAPSDRPLIIYACGNLTNVALALLKDPTIAPRIEIWWLGTEWPKNYACNNHVGDLDAVITSVCRGVTPALMSA